MRSQRRQRALTELFRRAAVPDAAVRQVRRRMSAPGRHYHGLDHLADLWTQHRLLSRGTAFRVPRTERLIASAILFHDAIYDPDRPDNEAASARLWRRLARLGPLPRHEIERVAAAIEATADHAAGHLAPTRSDPMLHWMLDLDLTSIGAPWHRFRGNSSLLRAEFADRPAAGWQQRTCLFLGALASRPCIYHSRRIAVAIEATARANIARELRATQDPIFRSAP